MLDYESWGNLAYSCFWAFMQANVGAHEQPFGWYSAASGESEECVKEMISKLKRLEMEESNLLEEKEKLQVEYLL